MVIGKNMESSLTTVRMNNIFISRCRFYLVFFAVLFAFTSLGGRLVQLQFVDAKKYKQVALGVRQNFISTPARRGDVVDRKGNLLATTRSVVELGLDPHSIEEEDYNKLPDLAKLLNLPESEILDAVKRKTRKDSHGELHFVRWVKLKDEVDEGTYREIKKLKIDGVYGNFKHSRLYPNQSLASHLLGYVNKEGRACMGVEMFADYYLKGQDGWRESERDGRRREMPQYRSFEVIARDGLNVELSLDRIIQDIVEEELNTIASDFEPLSASVIVSDPKTGEVLALANYPDFDPNKYNESELENQRNRILTDLYEPGSTFKIVPVAAAMNEGLVRPDDIIDCADPVYRVGSRNRMLPSDHHPLGKISLKEVVQKSSNRGAARLGIKLGASRLYDYCRAFGFGKETNLGLTGERKGLLHNPNNWDGLTITRLPMGHAVAVTALQVHQSMSVIANNGILMKPQIVRRVFDHEGKTVVPFDLQVKRRVVGSDVAQSLSEMLVSVVSKEGTARQAKISGFEVAGKTGTTQKLVDGRYSNQHHVASFVGYFPASDPKILATIVVDEPKMKKGRLGYGGSVAAPSFRRIGTRIIASLGLKPSEQEITFMEHSKKRNQAF
jgi:cell division protein FtsI/penicillin-binding protein 2